MSSSRLQDKIKELEAAAAAMEKEFGLDKIDAKKISEDFQRSIYSPAYEKSNTEKLKALLAASKYSELQALCRELRDDKFCAQDIYAYAHALLGYSESPLADINCKIRGLARSGYTNKVNQLIATAEDHYTAVMNAEAGYREGGFLDNDVSKIRILAMTADDKARLIFSHPAFRQDLYTIQKDGIDPQITHCIELLREAKEIRSDMNTYHLNYDQALEFRARLVELKQQREGGSAKKFMHQFFFGHPYQEGVVQFIADRVALADQIRERDADKTRLNMK